MRLSGYNEYKATSPAKERKLRGMIDACNPEDLETWGYPVSTIYEPLDNPPSDVNTIHRRKKRKSLGAFRVERIILRRLRRNIHHNAFGRLIRRIRFACDVLLR